VTPLVILAPRANTHSAQTPQIVVVNGIRSTQAIAKPKHSHIENASTEQAYIYATYHDVSVIVLNVDIYGLPLLKSFRTVFPQTALIAISKKPSTLASAARLGAIAVPSDASTARIATLIANVLKR